MSNLVVLVYSGLSLSLLLINLIKFSHNVSNLVQAMVVAIICVTSYFVLKGNRKSDMNNGCDYSLNLVAYRPNHL